MSSRAGFGMTSKDNPDDSHAKPVVLVVDDDISVREALQPLLELAGWRVISFPDAQAFLDWNESEPGQVGCLLLDFSLPDLNGLDLQERIAKDRPELPIIFLTGFGDVPMSVRAMKAGAAEFLTKPFDDEVLLTAVDRSIEKSREISAERASLKVIEERYAELSRREREVMALIVSGLLNKQVGGELGISEITVKAHRGRLMEKMKARSFADLVKMGQRLGLEPGARG
ncbi:response regulator transcription factor [Sphingomonas daechungensis]|nr:response regulator [Sphingomonas daechungensis]